MDSDLAQLKEGQVLGKDFRILKPLAAGGMGAVYLVEQLSTGRERALKIMHPQFVKSPDSRARFTQEAKVGARIRSDHVVEVVSAGVDDDTGIPWLAMELLDGEELAKRIQRKKFLPPSETLEIFRQLCHALGEAHKNGLVHRDLKPQNIFMARSRRQGEAFTVKILDFGVAKLVQEQQGEGDATKPVGTPRWMAPEQSDQGAAIRPATDVWALGLIAFNCLTGKFYWRTASLAAGGGDGRERSAAARFRRVVQPLRRSRPQPALPGRERRAGGVGAGAGARAGVEARQPR
ncbi:MAG: serine/threonine protein kinase [Deltaproteobacteria bacterium]|nr:MAG: serine/threonine protein kinase [Deltaproteobacteria bacterium]